jgi:hypothetical protein
MAALSYATLRTPPCDDELLCGAEWMGDAAAVAAGECCGDDDGAALVGVPTGLKRRALGDADAMGEPGEAEAIGDGEAASAEE